MAKKVTMNDIAAECNVSQTLVSFVLTGKEAGVGEITRYKIIEAARRLGYELPKRNTQKNAYLVCDRNFDAIPIIEVMSGMREVLSGAGYSLVFYGITDQVPVHDLSDMGFIVITSSKAFLEYLSELKVKFSFLLNDGSNAVECGENAAKRFLNGGFDTKLEDLNSFRLPGESAGRRDGIWLL